jgi:hypothetical protein
MSKFNNSSHIRRKSVEGSVLLTLILLLLSTSTVITFFSSPTNAQAPNFVPAVPSQQPPPLPIPAIQRQPVPLSSSIAPPVSRDIQFLGSTDLTALPNIPQIPTQIIPREIHKELTRLDPQIIQAIKAQIANIRLNVPVITPGLTTIIQSFPATGTTAAQPTPLPFTSSQNSASTPLSLSTGTGFEGLTESQSGYYYPPDVTVAAGPNYITELVNLEGKVFTKQGGTVSTFPLYQLFRISSNDFLTDPRILYDGMSGRWFASISDMTTNRVLVAVSYTSNPLTWRNFSLQFSACPDYPDIGLSADKFVATGNLWKGFECNSNAYLGAQYYVLNKSYLTGMSTTLTYTRSNPNVNVINLKAVQSLRDPSTSTQNPTLYMVSTDDSKAYSNYKVFLFTFSGSPTTPPSIATLTIQPFNIPPQAQQPGTLNVLDTGGDNRVLDAAFYRGKLWLAFNDACTPSGDAQTRSCFRLDQIDTTIRSVHPDVDVGSTGAYYFYPALRIDTFGNVEIVYGASSRSASSTPTTTMPGFPSIFGTGVTLGASSLNTATTLKIGSYPETTDRFGDYFGAGVDPAFPSSTFPHTVVWTNGEYHSSTYWSTYIRQIIR